MKFSNCGCCLLVEYRAIEREVMDLISITKTCPCNEQRLFKLCKMKIFFKIFNIFLIFTLTIDCGYTLEPPRRGGSNEHPQSVFLGIPLQTPVFFISKWPLSGV